ncbi:glycosyltransferase family 4 protein [Martelella alba]|uniref:Glycosyltransferase family 4 protein n=1 Tax=Martelella alba TaxID=2590451 RepID=A0A506U0D5_9HYPH|nr:glycosyltransferase family 4 protein [Martelella alba]TPW27803.1 glycosyltransferase family 4 protein [Martelella alba]
MKGSLYFAYPGELTAKTGGYGYDRRLIAGLEALGWQVHRVALGAGFPAPDNAVREEAACLLSSLPDGALVIVDGLAFGVMDDWAASEASRLRIVALVHHPLALETGLGRCEQVELGQSESMALRSACGVIATSPSTARLLAADYGVPAEKIAVALPGTDPVDIVTGSTMPPQILSVGTLTPRKGHDVLIAALKAVEDLAWTATIVGSDVFDSRTAAALRRQVEIAGLGHRIELTGAVEALEPHWRKAQIFALASRHEGYGMAFAEALAHGLPIIGCAAGAVPELVAKPAGILVPADDVAAFAVSLRQLLENAAAREAMAAAARKAGQALPCWHETAMIVSDVLEGWA